MRIIFDEPKRLSNLREHGLDMADFADGFDFAAARQFPARPSRTGRTRFGLVGWLDGAVVVAAILSPLGAEALSLVRLRAASQKEKELTPRGDRRPWTIDRTGPTARTASGSGKVVAGASRGAVAYMPSIMSYAVKEIFYTLQGEGRQAGRAAVFCRFAGCNLWSGREADRAAAVCRFCDTDFVGLDGPGGGRFADAAALAEAVLGAWAGLPERRLVVLTGGEPLLQVDGALLDALHGRGFEVAVETNGTLTPPPGLDWVCVSPKAAAPLALRRGDELKLVFPQADAMPERFEAMDFDHFILQPMDGPDRDAHTAAAVRYCMAHPRWRLGLQTHKVLGIA